MERIRRITASSIEVPLASPVRVGGYTVHRRDYCLVEIYTDTGRIGHSLAFSRGADLNLAIMRHVAPVLMGEDPEQIEQLWQRVYDSTRLIGRQGLLMRALSLVDIALWDLKAKKVNLPLRKLLGGFRESVPLLMAGGYYAADKALKELTEEFEGYVQDGYKHLKLMVGGESMEDDLLRYVTLRRNLPDGVTLGVDANGSWHDPKAVLRWIHKAEDQTGEALSFLEEPLPPENPNGTVWIRERTHVPIAVGEFLAGRWTFREWMEKGAIDIIRADATLCGGITEWRRISSLALAWNLRMFPHYFASLHIHLALAYPGCDWIEEVSRAGNNSSFQLLAGQSYYAHEGMAYPTNEPGLGLTMDPVAVKKYTLEVHSSQ
jgi:L-alanine-DL-glutamate epimerase-like enolase superfamily enzyme